MRHRNSQKRFYDEMSTYFITTNTKDGFPHFKEDLFCELFVENLRLCKKLKDFEIYAFAIIPAHVHLLIYPYEKYNISQIMFSIKKQFSHDANRVMGYNKPYPNPTEGDQTFGRLPWDLGSRLQERGVESRNQAGSGVESHLKGEEYEQHKEIIQKHQEKVNKLRQKFLQKYGQNQTKFPSFKWQKSFHDHVIRGEKDFQFHYDYTTYNPEQHKLVKKIEDYLWQSLNPKFDDFMDHA